MSLSTNQANYTAAMTALALLYGAAIIAWCLWLSGRKPTPEPKKYTEVK